MARTQIYEVIWDTDGTPVTGASVYVYNARTLVQATVYSTEGGGGTLTQPLSTTNGVIPGWVNEGEYDLAYTFSLSSGTRRFNAIVGGNPKLAADQVTATEIATDAVGSAEIVAGAVGSSEIGSDAVGSDELANDAVDTNAIQNLAVTAAKIANDTITAAQIAPDAITASELANNSVDTNAIVNDAVTAAKILDGEVGTAELAASAVTYAKIAAPTITTGTNLSAFGDGSITANTETDIVSITAPSAGTYIISYRLQAYNNWVAGSATPNTLVMNCKINGSTSWTETDEWNLLGTANDYRRHTFSGSFVAAVAGAHVIKLTLKDVLSSHTQVDIGFAVVTATRISA